LGDPRISVIMPAYNASATIQDALGSLVAQTSREFEVVVVDDGSTDETAEIVREVASRAPFVLQLVSKPNGGRADARNVGMAHASGEFLAFVDADDTAEPAMLELLLACADATGADLVNCEYLGVDALSGDVLFTYQEGDPSLYGGSAVERPELLSAISASVCNKLVHRSLFADTGIEFPSGLDFEDLATAYRLCGEARRIEKVAEPLYRYRLGGSSSIMAACDERYLDILDALALTNDHFAARGTFDALRTDLEVISFTHLIAGRLPDLLTTGAAGLRHEFIRRAFAHMDHYFPGWRGDEAIRIASGSTARFRVCTSGALLRLYSDFKAATAR
jgi:glycosyltransferase involved in cell wall biosynthesis